MTVTTLKTGEKALKIGEGKKLVGIRPWSNKAPYLQLVKEEEARRKDHSESNFPSVKVLSRFISERWIRLKDDEKQFFIDYTLTPCMEGIAHGPKGAVLKLEKGIMERSFGDGSKAAVVGIPQELVERYNDEVIHGGDALFFIDEYNGGSDLPEIEGNRIVYTPTKRGITVLKKNFVRENLGNIHPATGKKTNATKSEADRVWIYTVPNEDYFVGPPVFGYYGRVDYEYWRNVKNALFSPLFRLAAICVRTATQ